MNKHTLLITDDMTQMKALKYIVKEYKNRPGFLQIDVSEANFPLTRDFFLVLSQRLPRDVYKLIVGDEDAKVMAKSLGIQAEIAGIQAEFERKYASKNLATHNMSMLEYLIYEIKRGGAYIRFVLFERTQAKKKIIHMKKNSSHFVLIVMGLVMSVTLLLFILQFAVSKTVITITPQITIRPVSANILYTNTSGSTLMSRNTIPLRVMQFPVSYAMKFQLESLDQNSTSNAKGTITIYNGLSTAQSLRPKTRFVTLDGIVYRSTQWVKIPGAKTLNGITEMWTTEVEVIADPRDGAGNIVGVRGNIKAWVDFTIPGLKFNRENIYAKSKSDFSGGENPKIHIVTQNEVEKLKWLLKEQLHRVARNTLQQKLDENKKSSWDDYVLFSGNAVAFEGDIFEIISWQKVGDLAEEIEIKGTVNVRAITYDKKSTVSYLTDIFHEWLLSGTDREIGIDPESLRVSNQISRTDSGATIEIKATMEMNTSIAHDFEDPRNKVTHFLKTTIAGLLKDDAKKRLLNTGNVREVQIASYPFWNRSVSSNIDNIEFIIKK